MDGNRFDSLTREFAAGESRRRLLKRLVAGAAAAIGVGAIVRSPGGEAAVCRAGGDICRTHSECCSRECLAKDRSGRQRCACVSGTTACGTDCCAPGEVCANGVCRTPTPTRTATRTPVPPTSTAEPPTTTPNPTPGAHGVPCDADDQCASNLCCAGVCCDQACLGGVCTPCTLNSHCDDNNKCTTDSCDSTTGNCLRSRTRCGPNETCDPTDGKCYECSVDDDCDPGMVCSPSSRTCWEPTPTPTPSGPGGSCQSSEDCADDLHCCSAVCCQRACENDVCTWCDLDSDCDDGDPCTVNTCEAGTNRCVSAPKSCTRGQLCDPSDGTCRTCLSDAHCVAPDRCTIGQCTPSGCAFTPVVCGAGSRCDLTDGQCRPTAG